MVFCNTLKGRMRELAFSKYLRVKRVSPKAVRMPATSIYPLR